LTEKATAQFPNNYQRLAVGLLQELKDHLPPEGVNVILEGVASQMAQEAEIPAGPIENRLDMAADYLNSRGYEARWEAEGQDFVLYTSNCPYHQAAEDNLSLCDMDLRLVASLLQVVPRRISHVMSGDPVCAYRIPGSAE
jgi:predicted ArsR family transcriptional regulator